MIFKNETWEFGGFRYSNTSRYQPTNREVTVHFFMVFCWFFCGIAPGGMIWCNHEQSSVWVCPNVDQLVWNINEWFFLPDITSSTNSKIQNNNACCDFMNSIRSNWNHHGLEWEVRLGIFTRQNRDLKTQYDSNIFHLVVKFCKSNTWFRKSVFPSWSDYSKPFYQLKKVLPRSTLKMIRVFLEMPSFVQQKHHADEIHESPGFCSSNERLNYAKHLCRPAVWRQFWRILTYILKLVFALATFLKILK